MNIYADLAEKLMAMAARCDIDGPPYIRVKDLRDAANVLRRLAAPQTYEEHLGQSCSNESLAKILDRK